MLVSGRRSSCCSLKCPPFFSVGGEYTGASIFVAEYAPDRKRGFFGSWFDSGSIAGFVFGAGLVVLISTIQGEVQFEAWGWRLPFFLVLPLRMIELYLRHAREETLAFQQHVDQLELEDREGLARDPSDDLHRRSGSYNVTHYMLLIYM